jgi:hypothetical protein
MASYSFVESVVEGKVEGKKGTSIQSIQSIPARRRTRRTAWPGISADGSPGRQAVAGDGLLS